MLSVSELSELLNDYSLREICNHRNLSYSKLYRFCKKHNIEVTRKNNGKSRKTLLARKQRRKIPDDYDLLYDLYVTQGLGLKEIASMYNTTKATVSAALKRNNIKVKFTNGKYEKRTPKYSKDKLILLYEELNLSLQEIADRLDYKHHGEVCEDFKYYNIKRRSYKQAGALLYEKHPEKKDLHRKQFYQGTTGPKENVVTSLEQAFIDWADSKDINYVFQFQIRKNWHRYDFLIKDTNIIVEMDGVFWHSLPEHIERDKRFDDTAARYGYTVIRITDSELSNNSNVFNEKILTLLEEQYD